MLDIKWIRENKDAFEKALARRGFDADAQNLLELDRKRRINIEAADGFRHRRKQLSAQVAQAKERQDSKEAEKLSESVKSLKAQIQKHEEEDRFFLERMEEILLSIPNCPLDDVPDGKDESGNIEQHYVGDKPVFDFKPVDHTDIGEGLGMMDFSTATKLSGARFVVLRGALARLERALASFMLDIHTQEFGYQEVVPPFLVREDSMYGTAQLPKFADDQFSTQSGLWLIPTAEVPLTNLAREHIFDEKELPLRFTAATPCFRKEAGAAGRDTRGMIRQHQFSKVELVSIVRPVDSPNELKRMLGCAEEVLKRLELHYRVVLLCTGDMGFAASKTYDIEVWLPGEDKYREISSCSSCGDFQARRMKARYRRNYDRRIETVHTLNGSGVALGRALLALLEQKQCADGSVLIPEALRPYMGGMERIERRDL
ncbi:MAG: serine--tRNA ligase [Hyphomicrobiales bacterium]|nr:serine--tRNA ligase [Hyphomicrobiales bacterium]